MRHLLTTTVVACAVLFAGCGVDIQFLGGSGGESGSGGGGSSTGGGEGGGGSRGGGGGSIGGGGSGGCGPDGAQQSCYDGPSATEWVGPCKSGVQTCLAGAWGPCVGEVIPALELCDGQDNDCDGLVDNGVPGVGDTCNLPPFANTPCYAGTMKCQINGPPLACVPNIAPGVVPETCDAVDNDCDGTVDNGQFCCPGDNVKSGNETDLDCGGSCDTKCADDKSCNFGIDCQSGNCVSGFCLSPTCNDGVINGGEPDLDCGQVCPNKCLVGQSCNDDDDCASSLCHPADKHCIQKVNGAACLEAQECSSNYCADGVCCDTSCSGNCLLCNLPGSIGSCSYVPAGQDPNDECASAQTCNGAGLCQ